MDPVKKPDVQWDAGKGQPAPPSYGAPYHGQSASQRSAPFAPTPGYPYVPGGTPGYHYSYPGMPGGYGTGPAPAGFQQDYRTTVTLDDTLNRRTMPVLDNQQSTVTLENWLTFVRSEIEYRRLIHPRSQILFALRHLDKKLADVLSLQNIQEGDWPTFLDTLKILVRGSNEPSRAGLSRWVSLQRWRSQDCEEFLAYPVFISA